MSHDIASLKAHVKRVKQKVTLGTEPPATDYYLDTEQTWSVKDLTSMPVTHYCLETHGDNN
jgi:hypothetical protein